MRPTTQLLGAVSAVALVAMSSAPALAEGTTAGDSITNNVSVAYQVGGVDQTAATASDTFVVDRKVDVVVDFTGTSNTSVSPGEDNVVLAFDVTNLSNDVVDLDLATALTAGTGANISNIEIYLDSDGDGSLSPAELSAGPITFLDEVAADDGTGADTVAVLVVADIGLAAVDGDTFNVDLTANAFNGGDVGSLGATELVDTAGANTAGVDTVLADGAGTTDSANQGDFSDVGTYEVAAAAVTVSKTSSIISDPVNGATNPKAIPGAIIEYCITVANGSGAATATSVNVNDLLPADVTYDGTFGIFVDGNATCAAGTRGDNIAVPTASFGAGTGPSGEDEVSGTLSDIAAGVTRSLYFRVEID